MATKTPGKGAIFIGLALIALGLLLYIIAGYTSTGTSRETIVNETFYLGPESYRWYCTPKYPFANDRVVIYINVLSGYGGIDFYAMDELNLKNFEEGKTFYYYPEFSSESVVRTTIEWDRPSNFQWGWTEGVRMCYVYDNKDPLFGKTVETWIVYENETSENPLSPMGFVSYYALAAGLAIFVSGLIVAIVHAWRKTPLQEHNSRISKFFPDLPTRSQRVS